MHVSDDAIYVAAALPAFATSTYIPHAPPVPGIAGTRTHALMRFDRRVLFGD
jgi:hypothetical protein